MPNDASNQATHKIRQATLIEGTLRAAEEGVRGAHVAAARLEGELVRVYVKPLPWPKIIAECFGALLLRHWRLNVPEPLLVEIDGRNWFGSLDAEYPSLTRRLLINDSCDTIERKRRTMDAVAVAMAVPDTPRAMACDEAIANVDRNLGNILWDGANVAWIDHENTFDVTVPAVNKLAEMALFAEHSQDIERKAVTIALELDATGIQGIIDAIEHSTGCARLVERRLEDLPGRLIARFPVPSGDLFAITH